MPESRAPAPSVLLVGGLDPSGGAGLAADARALAFARVHARPVASALTVQTGARVRRVRPVEPDLVAEQVQAALEEGVHAVKTGLLSTPAPLEGVARDVPLVVDPVLHATSDGSALAAAELYRPLLSRATLATPNLREARALTGLEEAEAAAWALRKLGARNVLVTGGDAEGERVRDVLLSEDGEVRVLDAPRVPGGPFRGTGCTLGSLAAAHLAQGYRVADAVDAAVEETRELLRATVPQPVATPLPSEGFSLLPDARGLAPEARARVVAVASAWRRLLPALSRQHVPEVGSNLSFLPENGEADAAAVLSARCVRAGRGIVLAGPVEVGGIHHTARIAATAHRHDARVRAAMNLKMRPRLVERALALGWNVARFDRALQPPEAPSSMEWGTDVACSQAGRVPDLIYDEGAPGKEPMMRILGEGPGQVADKALQLVTRS